MSLIRFKRYAVRDLDDIWLYIRTDNEPAADAFINQLWAAIGILSDAPRSGQSRPDLGNRLRARPVGNYLIVYRPIADGVEVVRIFQGNRAIHSGMLRRR